MARPAPRPAVLLVVAVLVAGLVPVTAGAQQAQERELERARSELDRIASEIERAEADADEANAALDDAEATLEELEAIVNDVAERVRSQRTAVRDAERRLSQVQREADEIEALFDDRVARMYKQGPDLSFEVMLGAANAEDAMARTSLLARVAESEQVELEHLEAAKVAVASERERLEIEQQRLAGMLEEQRELRDEADELREHRALAAANAESELDELNRQHDDLEDEEAELQATIERIQEQEERRQEEQRRAANASSSTGSNATPSSATSSSGFGWPACGPVTSEFGPRWGRQHRGIDLGLSTGTSVVASKAGTVLLAAPQGGYGNLVLIDHHDGVVTAYAHLSSFQVSAGQSVSKGQTVASSGNTGNSTGPHLHFETRANGTAVNPRQYLSGSPC